MCAASLCPVLCNPLVIWAKVASESLVGSQPAPLSYFTNHFFIPLFVRETSANKFLFFFPVDRDLLLSVCSGFTPAVDTSKQTPYRCAASPLLPSILQSESSLLFWTTPASCLVLRRENSSLPAQFPFPRSSSVDASAGHPDQTGPQCGAEFCGQARRGLWVRGSQLGGAILTPPSRP